MSSHGPSQTVSPSSNFKSMLDAALAEYQKKTGDDLLAHWLATEMQTCESVDSVLDILRDQAKTFEQSGDQKLMKWIDPLVHVLHTFSDALGDGVSLAFPPAKVIFTGIGALLAAAKDARASQGAVIDLFERIESFFKRLEVYTQISLTTNMAEVLVKIVIELLSILSIATKEVKRRLAKVFSRKLLGRTDIEDALKRLESLIQEEIQMAIAQILKTTTEVKDGADKIDVAMQQMSNDIGEVRHDVGDVKHDIVEIKWTQIEQDIHRWFSSPDPSTNYNICCKAQSEGTTAWFFEGAKFKDWMSIGSLLWIYGKPGSGKSILCSAIIKHILSLRDAGKASLAFFYFDFRDEEKKQDIRNFVTSLIVQLSAYSSQCCKITSRIYSEHGKGSQQPSNDTLTNCFQEMLSVAAQQPIYLIVDALDEYPDSSRMPTPREDVLDLLEDLISLSLPNLRICVTSRPENDIKAVLGPLASGVVSLHDECGQKKDISDYVRNAVYSDKKMRSWRSDQKELVIEELSKKADGMFRWVFCQLEVLRHCLPASIRQTLDQLPESLDETYLRVLSQIPRANQAHTHRMLQCLMVAVRPLYVEELAELLAFEFDTAQGGIPKYRAALRLDDQTRAVLSTCSSLVAIVDTWYGRQIVQFSHFSVKEFLMSNRLGDLSRYHIYPASAHTILTRACLGSLIHMDDDIDEESVNRSPLAKYAAIHWVEHARFEDVASRVKEGMETLFDSDKPHFTAWIRLYDMDKPANWWDSVAPPKSKPIPLYYSVLCGLYDLVKLLAIKHPEHINAICGQHDFPLLAALSHNYVEIAELLLEHSANVDGRETTGKTILFKVLSQPQHSNLVNIVKFLLEHGAHPKLAVHDSKTTLHILSENQIDNEGDILDLAQLLLKHGAEVDRRDKDYQTPLHLSMERGQLKLAKILLQHGADANAEDSNGKTPFHINSGVNFGWTPLHLAAKGEYGFDQDVIRIVQVLLERGADVHARDNNNETPLHLASYYRSFSIARVLLDGGAAANSKGNFGRTPLHSVAASGVGYLYSVDDGIRLTKLLLDRGANVNALDEDNASALHLTSEDKVARVLLGSGAAPNSKDNQGRTPLHAVAVRANFWRSVLVARLLLEHGADVDASDRDDETPLHLASYIGKVEMVRVLLNAGANASAKNAWDETPLHKVLKCQSGFDATRVLLEYGADVNAQDINHATPLDVATYYDRTDILTDIISLLLQYGGKATRRAQRRELAVRRALH